MKDFRSKTLKGISWSMLNQFVVQVITFTVSIVLARLLSPQEFGLIGMVTVVIGFIRMFKDMGLGSALIQKKEVTQTDLSTVFWFNLLLGAVLSSILYLSAPFVASFYEEPLVEQLMKWLSMSFFISSVGSIHDTRMRKEIDFKRIFFLQLGANLATGSLGIYLAFTGWGVWALVYKQLFMSVINVILVWTFTSWRPSFLFSRASLKSLFGFSFAILGSSALSYWMRSLDNILIGKYLGVTQLGIYSRAYSLMLLPLKNISAVLGQVLFPSFSLIQDDILRVKKIYMKVSRTVALITFPAMVGLLVIADTFILAVLGPKWEAVIPIIRILSMLGMLQSIASLNGSIYLSQGATGIQFKVGLFTKSLMIAGIILGLNWGIQGVAIGYTITSCVAMIFEWYYMGRLISTSVKEIIVNLIPVLACALLMGGVVYGVGQYVTLGHVLFQFAFDISIGAIVYFAFLKLFKVEAFNEVQALVLARLGALKKTQPYKVK